MLSNYQTPFDTKAMAEVYENVSSVCRVLGKAFITLFVQIASHLFTFPTQVRIHVRFKVARLYCVAVPNVRYQIDDFQYETHEKLEMA